MTLLVQITDTHILPPGNVLHGEVDTARHLRETVRQINRFRPSPDLIVVTGDLAEHGDEAGYRHFIELLSPLEMPVYVLPGNHDNPSLMSRVFAGTSYFPAKASPYQYAVEHFPFRILALNSLSAGSELPGFDAPRLQWLQDQLERSDKPTLIALHHPPMKTGIELIDMGGTAWFQGLKSLLNAHKQVKMVICGHCHTDLCGRIGQVPVYMAQATSHQLVGSRALTVAPAAMITPGTPVLHQFIDGEFLSGSNAWPPNLENERIDKKSGRSWEDLKQSMRGSKS